MPPRECPNPPEWHPASSDGDKDDGGDGQHDAVTCDDDTSHHRLGRLRLDEIASAKSELRSALSANHGLASRPAVLAAIEALSELNPTPKPASSALMHGAWRNLSAPSFPNRIPLASEDEEDVFKYTLGRMSFGIFEPRELVCTVESVGNPVRPLELEGEAEEGRHGRGGDDDDATAAAAGKDRSGGGVGATMSYPFLISLIVHAPDGTALPATMLNEGTATPSSDERCSVVFAAGTLGPRDAVTSDPAKLALWRTMFAGAYARADKERSYLSSIGRLIVHRLLRLTAPSDAAATALGKDDSFRFEMGSPPRGYFDVLYLDEDMRITRGNRGTYVVAERER